MKRFKAKTLKLEKEFSSHDWACLHDAVIDSLDKDCNQDELEVIFNKLPIHIKDIAFRWGMSDTVFGDRTYNHLKDLK